MQYKIFFVALLVLISACAQQVTTTTETPVGTLTYTGPENPEWCQAGSEWSFSSSTFNSDAFGKWIIDKYETSGQYAGLCHVVFTSEGPEGEVRLDYWFDEKAENGYIEIVTNNQTIKQEWHKNQ